ncbi:MAG: hypothetical protein ABR610_08300 [Thermoanaerobaculia bacterium]
MRAMRLDRAPWLAVALALGPLALILPSGACRKGDDAGRPGNSQAAPAGNGASAPASGASTEAAPAAVHVTDVSLGKSVGPDRKVQSPTDRFGPNDTIFASVSTDGAGKAATIFARWTFEDGQVIRNDQKTVSPSGPAVTDFSVEKPGGWPKGGYKLDVSVDSGGAASTKTFRVE